MPDKYLALIAIVLALSASLTQASVTCAAPLASVPDRIGFQERLFKPQYSPSLSHTGGAINDDNMSKRLSKADVKRLQTPKPVVTASGKLDAAAATWLRNTLNQHADFQVPGWFSTALGLAAPAAWVGVGADVMIQLINGSGSAGQVKLANLVGTVSEGGSWRRSNGWLGVLRAISSFCGATPTPPTSTASP